MNKSILLLMSLFVLLLTMYSCNERKELQEVRGQVLHLVIDGDSSYIKRIDQTGYEFIKTELGIDNEKEENDMNKVSIGSCAVKDTVR